MADTLLIENLDAKVLFDCWATHSFISRSLLCKLSKLREILKQMLVVNTSLERMLPITYKVKECEIKIGKCVTKKGLMVWKMEDYDVKLIM